MAKVIKWLGRQVGIGTEEELDINTAIAKFDKEKKDAFVALFKPNSQIAALASQAIIPRIVPRLEAAVKLPGARPQNAIDEIVSTQSPGIDADHPYSSLLVIQIAMERASVPQAEFDALVETYNDPLLVEAVIVAMEMWQKTFQEKMKDATKLKEWLPTFSAAVNIIQDAIMQTLLQENAIPVTTDEGGTGDGKGTFLGGLHNPLPQSPVLLNSTMVDTQEKKQERLKLFTLLEKTIAPGTAGWSIADLFTNIEGVNVDTGPVIDDLGTSLQSALASLVSLSDVTEQQSPSVKETSAPIIHAAHVSLQEAEIELETLRKAVQNLEIENKKLEAEIARLRKPEPAIRTRESYESEALNAIAITLIWSAEMIEFATNMAELWDRTSLKHKKTLFKTYIGTTDIEDLSFVDIFPAIFVENTKEKEFLTMLSKTKDYGRVKDKMAVADIKKAWTKIFPVADLFFIVPQLNAQGTTENKRIQKALASARMTKG